MLQIYIPDSKQLEVSSSAIARRLFWHLFSIGTIYLDHADHHQPFDKPGVHLFWVVSGKGTLETQDFTYSLGSGNSVWFIDMMHSRTYAPQSGRRLTIRGIRFGLGHLRMWHEELGGSGRAEFSLASASLIKDAYAELWRIVQSKPTAWEWRVHLILDRIVGQLLVARHIPPAPLTEVPEPVARVINAVLSNPLYDWKAKDLVRIARVSYSGLRLAFRQSQRETLHSFIQRTRLSEAKRLLSDPSRSINEVAEQLHFSSPFYFSYFFKRSEGVSPTEFRNRLKHGPMPDVMSGRQPDEESIRADQRGSK